VVGVIREAFRVGEKVVGKGERVVGGVKKL
jgi:hypothetical protein